MATPGVVLSALPEAASLSSVCVPCSGISQNTYISPSGTPGNAPAGTHGVRAKVTSVHYQGAVTRVNTDAAGQSIAVSAPSSLGLVALGDEVTLSWHSSALHAMENEA